MIFTYIQYVLLVTIYESDDCIEMSLIGHQKESKRCRHVHYPNHPRASSRTLCGSLLLKKVRCKSGYKLSPIKFYPYKCLRKSIEQFVKREGFLENCEKWRKWIVSEGFLCDIYVGAL